MSNESVISEVQKHPSLWNLNHVHYHNRLMNDRLWSSVAEAVNLPKEAAKHKWKNLRDAFNREFTKIPKPRSGASAEDAPIYNGKWAHFNAMMFLKDVTPRRTESNIPESEVDNNDLYEPAVEKETETRVTKLLSKYIIADIDMSDTGTAFGTGAASGTGTASKKKKPTQDKVCISPDSVRPAKKSKIKEGPLSGFEKEMLKTEKEKLDLFREPEDDDMHFFKSILPYFKQMTPLQKLRVRSKIQEVVVNELSVWPTFNPGNSDDDYDIAYYPNTSVRSSADRNFY